MVCNTDEMVWHKIVDYISRKMQQLVSYLLHNINRIICITGYFFIEYVIYGTMFMVLLPGEVTLTFLKPCRCDPYVFSMNYVIFMVMGHYQGQSRRQGS